MFPTAEHELTLKNVEINTKEFLEVKKLYEDLFAITSYCRPRLLAQKKGNKKIG